MPLFIIHSSFCGLQSTFSAIQIAASTIIESAYGDTALSCQYLDISELNFGFGSSQIVEVPRASLFQYCCRSIVNVCFVFSVHQSHRFGCVFGSVSISFGDILFWMVVMISKEPKVVNMVQNIIGKAKIGLKVL
eukprot:278084_1